MTGVLIIGCALTAMLGVAFARSRFAVDRLAQHTIPKTPSPAAHR